MGKIYVVGLGPGSAEGMTAEALKVLEQSEVIVGYDLYIDLIRERYEGKQLITTGMRQETERCGICLDLAKEGKNVSLVCSGDAGVYGMASLMLEVAGNASGIEVEIVAGVTAALSGAAILGAPLGHDFCVISLSDLLTPWELIEKRLHYAAMADLVIVIYNPSSKKRRDHLKRACEIIAAACGGERLCGLVRNIDREGESHTLCTLSELKELETDMFTTVFIGNSESRNIGGRFVTPRGYKNV